MKLGIGVSVVTKGSFINGVDARKIRGCES